MDNKELARIQEIENKEWSDSLDYIIEKEGPERAKEILLLLQTRSQLKGIDFTYQGNTPYINTITPDKQAPYPGSRELERKIKSIIRWNAMAMVTRANKEEDGIGGHISTFASSATLYEVGFNHFFRGGDDGRYPDIIYFQGHAAPGIYARSFMEGRLTEEDLKNFRRELRGKGGLSSYPHPRSMPEYWQFPTVSMGLGPLTAIYQARFNQYMQDKGLIAQSDQKVWAFLGDGEMDEPESMGALTLASREELDNLIFVVNCNLQRLDGPVRGNGSIIQELESAFHGAGWNVIKVIQGSDWDPLFEKDTDGMLTKRFGELVDGERQRYSISSGEVIRKGFFEKYEQTAKMVENYSDEQLQKLGRGGHDPLKVYNAYLQAVNHKGAPTVILAATIKGYGLGEAGEGRNITHQQKKLNEKEMKYFRGRFGIPISDEGIGKAPFFKPEADSEEIKYLLEQRQKLGGFLPKRRVEKLRFDMPDHAIFEEYSKDSGNKDVATTMVIVQILSKLLKDKNVGKLIVPIVPDESRTFGMDALFRQVGIYSHQGQLYEPVDRDSLMYYKEAKNGAILEEGINEAGSMSSFIAAGTSHSTHGVNNIPFFIFYSMFGFQRIGDLIWAAADARAKGFMIGGTSGRTTLAGEGLQHQDGNSHLLAMTYPSIRAYDPAFAFELSIIVEEGIREMYVEGKDVLYYITVMNEKYHMPAKPPCTKEHVLKGMYQYKYHDDNQYNVNLMGSGSILNQVILAADLLEKEFGIGAHIWSVTSYKALYDDVREIDRYNNLNPDKKKTSHLRFLVGDNPGLYVAATDYVKALPLSVSKYFPGEFAVLGTDGFGLSEGRESLRDHFEVDARHIVWTTLVNLVDSGKLDKSALTKARKKLKINPDKADPAAI